MSKSSLSHLSALPTELQLRIVDFLSTPALLNLTRASKGWRDLIEDLKQDRRIYQARTRHPPGAHDFSFLKAESTSFTHYYTNYAHINSWRDLCRAQTLLSRSWSRENPTIRTSLIAPRRHDLPQLQALARGSLDPPRIPVWRFRPDFERRFVTATTQHGGLLVTDLDSGNLLWSLPRDDVIPYAHLEYSNGHMAFNRYSDTIEIWKHVSGPNGHRGQFEQVALLPHDVQTRGFQLTWPTLCVVSSEGAGFVWDLSAPDSPQLTKRMDIATGIVGHLDQEPEAVMYCMGTSGYDFHSKATGTKLGSLNPKTFATAENAYHVSHRHYDASNHTVATRAEPLPAPFPPRRPEASHKPQPQPLRPGTNTARTASLATLDDDEWGAGLMRGDIMIAISKGGRCMLCLDWRGALKSPKRAAQVTFLIEMEINAHTFDFGGWLGVKCGPPGPTVITCEVDDKIYIFRLCDEDIPALIDGEKPLTDTMDVLSVPSTYAPTRLGVPISFMGVYDDCIMHTCCVGIAAQEASLRDPYIAKAIRVISFAPTPVEMGLKGYPSQTAVNGYVGWREEEDDKWDERLWSRFEH